MRNLKIVLGISVLFTFALMAGSVVCLSSGQANVMHGCGNGIQTVAPCPFMAISVPAIVDATTLTRTLGLALILTFAGGIFLRFIFNDDRVKKHLIFLREQKTDMTTGRRSDVMLRLMSDGILHPRVFGF